ncbi:unnamed protein product [Adineta ricciae]|uniref:Uncharacterized protein n=1 Tax=Adineta ricciae TaxID=249248 RepID=A0A814AMK2_ADIRI|nr:unnamed protein product [Adineta ricciae]CAF1039889.1 unnamed protein product [Adineta ricciae]
MHVLIILISFTVNANASHFLGGIISWRVQNASTNNSLIGILITQTYSWTYVPGRCDNNSIITNQLVSGASGTLTCSPSCPPGCSGISAAPICTDLSILNGIAVGQRSDIVYVPVGSSFSIIYASSAWGTLSLGGTAWSIASRINLARRSDNNMFNNAPVATIMSPVNIEVNQKTWITVSVSDADGDVVRCRWAGVVNGVDECSSVCSPGSLPPNSILYSNCTLEITGPTIRNKYAVALMVEDFINSTSTIPLSSVPVQYLVSIVGPASCLVLPEITFSGSSCTPIKVNDTFYGSIFGINHCSSNVTILDISTLSFPGLIQGPLTALNSTIYYRALQWTPTIKQLGFQGMCAMALNSEKSQSPQYCFTFYVTENGTSTCPVATISNATTTTTTTTTKTSANHIDWPLIAGVCAALALAVLGCCLCLLLRIFKCYPFSSRRRSSKNNGPEHSKLPMHTRKISTVRYFRNENPNDLSENSSRSSLIKINNHRQPNIAEVSQCSHKIPRTVPSNDTNLNDKSTDNDCGTSITQSRHNVHVKRIRQQYLKSMFDDKSSKMKKIRPHNTASTNNMNVIPNAVFGVLSQSQSQMQIQKPVQPKTEHAGNSFTNVTISHISRSNL